MSVEYLTSKWARICLSARLKTTMLAATTRLESEVGRICHIEKLRRQFPKILTKCHIFIDIITLSVSWL